MTWWQRLLAWFNLSEPGTRKEQAEDWISANAAKIAGFGNRQSLRRADRGHYFQRLKGWLRPSDDADDDQENDFSALPVWANVSIDVWEAPVAPKGSSEKGYTLNVFITEADATEWVLRIDSKNGSLGWSQVVQP